MDNLDPVTPQLAPFDPATPFPKESPLSPKHWQHPSVQRMRSHWTRGEPLDEEMHWIAEWFLCTSRVVFDFFRDVQEWRAAGKPLSDRQYQAVLSVLWRRVGRGW